MLQKTQAASVHIERLSAVIQYLGLSDRRKGGGVLKWAQRGGEGRGFLWLAVDACLTPTSSSHGSEVVETHHAASQHPGDSADVGDRKSRAVGGLTLQVPPHPDDAVVVQVQAPQAGELGEAL